METVESIEYDSEKKTVYISSGNVTGKAQGVDKRSYLEIKDHFKELIIGSVIWHKERIKLELESIRKINNLTPQSLGLIDIALWDLLGKINQLPVYQLLGGFRNQIPAYSESFGDIKDIRADIDKAQRAGFTAHQFEFSNTNHVSKELAILRNEISESFIFLATGKNSLTLQDAIFIARELESLDFHWFECPLSNNDPNALQKLNTSVSLPIVDGNFCISNAAAAMKGLVDRVVDRLRFEIPTMGGISEAIKWARGSEALGMNCEIAWTNSVGPNPAVHVLGAIRNAELISWRPNESNLMFSEGNIIIPPLPGLGYEINNEANSL